MLSFSFLVTQFCSAKTVSLSQDKIKMALRQIILLLQKNLKLQARRPFQLGCLLLAPAVSVTIFVALFLNLSFLYCHRPERFDITLVHRSHPFTAQVVVPTELWHFGLKTNFSIFYAPEDKQISNIMRRVGENIGAANPGITPYLAGKLLRCAVLRSISNFLVGTSHGIGKISPHNRPGDLPSSPTYLPPPPTDILWWL